MRTRPEFGGARRNSVAGPEVSAANQRGTVPPRKHATLRATQPLVGLLRAALLPLRRGQLEGLKRAEHGSDIEGIDAEDDMILCRQALDQ